MFDKKLLNKMIEENYVSVRKHPTAELYIYNYTPKAQYDRVWNDVTLQCRGLILDGDMNVVSRTFKKFFNLEELQPEEIPNLPFDVYDKLDGSLAILYWVDNLPYIATRGSFESEQAIKGTEIFYKKYSHLIPTLDKTKTYLFEIIYPSNKIVVDYGDMEDLILLTVIDNKTGAEHNLEGTIGFPIVKKYDGLNDYTKLKALEENNKEGFVIRFSNNFRMKVKFAEYVRLHRIITQCSNLVIWEHLMEKRELNDLLDKVPDEFYQWVKKTMDELQSQYNKIEEYCKSQLPEILAINYPEDAVLTKKERALLIQTKEYQHVLYAMVSNKDYHKIIYKMLRPTFSKPFKTEIE